MSYLNKINIKDFDQEDPIQRILLELTKIRILLESVFEEEISDEEADLEEEV